MKLIIALVLAGAVYSAAALDMLTITVSSNPLWTDTGISLSGGSTAITATGSWSTGLGFTGPDGLYVPEYAYDEWLQNGWHGQLLAYVGANPYSGTVNVDYFAIGSSGVLNGLSGELWLGFNDDMVSGGVGDNEGSVIATVAIPEPGAGAILALGSVVFGLRRRLATF
jgi:hypothetical protein